MLQSRLLRIVILFPLFVINFTLGQIDLKIVGKTADRIITAEEFQERYEFTPGFKLGQSGSSESIKLKFLYTLLAEKLWALEAEALELNTLEVMRFSKSAFEKMFVRHELYQREILDRLEISEIEIIEGYYKFLSTLYINYLISEDKEEIFQLYSYLNEGIPFDSILAESPELLEQSKPVKVVYGQMEESIEDSLYNLKIGDYTSPILTPDGWYIFTLKNRSEQPFINDYIPAESRNSVEKIISARKEKKLYWQFKMNLLKDKSVNADPVLFESLVRKISSTLSKKQIRDQIKAGDPVYLLSDEVLLIENEFGRDSLMMDFILFEDNPIILNEFIRSLAFNGFNTTDCSMNYMRGLIDSKTREVIEQEIFFREGLKQNLNLSPEVQKQVSLWYDNYLMQILQEKFLDSASVTHEELAAYYNSRYKEEEYPTLIRIFQASSRNLQLLEEIRSTLNSDKAISDIESEFSDNDSIIFAESELLPVNHFSKIGEIALTMNINDVFGPTEFDDQYLIFKLLEKVDSKTIPPIPIERVEDNLSRELIKKKVNSRMNNYTMNLAIKYGVSIDLKLLESIEVTGFSSFGIRNLGFGGKINAVPLVAPNFDWVKDYIETVNKIQP